MVPEEGKSKMKLKEAISEAFGRTQNIRRASWDASHHAVISILGNEEVRLIHVRDVGNTNEDDGSDDWELYPGKAPKFDWRSVLSSSDENTARDAKCKLTFASRQLEADDCLLAWVVPYKLSFLVRCDDKRFNGWPQAEDHLYTPLKDTSLKVHIVPKGLEQEFTVVGIERLSCGEDVRMYRFTVKTPEPTPPQSES